MPTDSVHHCRLVKGAADEQYIFSHADKMKNKKKSIFPELIKYEQIVIHALLKWNKR
jgi:hypothetical protein